MFATVGGQLASYLARRRKRARARRAFDGAGALVVALDADGRVEIANGTACAALGLAEDELLGRDWFATAGLGPRRVGRASSAGGDRLAAADARASPGAGRSRRDADGAPLGAVGWGEPARAAARSPPSPASLDSHAPPRARPSRRRRTARSPPAAPTSPRPPSSGGSDLADLDDHRRPRRRRRRRAEDAQAHLQGADRQRRVRRRRRRLRRRPRAHAGRHGLHADLRRPRDGDDQGHDPRRRRRRDVLAHRRLRDRALGAGRAAAGRRCSELQGRSVRAGPRFERAQARLARRGDRARRAPRRASSPAPTAASTCSAAATSPSSAWSRRIELKGRPAKRRRRRPRRRRRSRPGPAAFVRTPLDGRRAVRGAARHAHSVSVGP